MTAADALLALLRSLGVSESSIPADAAQRTARYRSLTAETALLVVLDNVRSTEQIRDLLPAGPDCFSVVTSRETLTGLITRHGARQIEVGVLSPAESATLLRALIGNRVDAAPDDAAQLAEQCARLPLALRIAAELANGRPALDLADLTAELSDRSERLDLFDMGDDHSAVRSVFAWSYDRLPEPPALLFRLLGLHPGRDAAVDDLAALSGLSARYARHAARTLVRAHLVHESAAGRIGTHDLLKAYGAELAVRVEQPDVVDRILGHYADAARSASLSAYGGDSEDRSAAELAAAWLDLELENLISLAHLALRTGRYDMTRRLIEGLERHLDTGGRYIEALVVQRMAERAARSLGDLPFLATTLNSIGVAEWRTGHYQGAAAYFDEAGSLYQELADDRGLARVLNNLGILSGLTGDPERGIAYFERALQLHRGNGDRRREGGTLNNLGLVLADLGRYDEAMDCYRSDLVICEGLGDLAGAAETLGNMGLVQLRIGRHAEALDHHQRSVEIYSEVRDLHGEANALGNLGNTLAAIGDEAAIPYLEKALRMHRDMGDAVAEAGALNGLGAALTALGRPGEAVRHHRESLLINVDVQDAEVELQGLNGLGEAHLGLGDPTSSASRHRSAEELARRTGTRHELARALMGISRALRAVEDADAELYEEEAETVRRPLDLRADGHR